MLLVMKEHRYDIVLTVASGVISGLLLHIIINYRILAGRKTHIANLEHEHAVEYAISVAHGNTGIPKKCIEVIEIHNDKDIYSFLLSDSINKRCYFVVYTPSIGVTEYRMYNKPLSLSEIRKDSLLLQLLSSSDYSRTE